MTQEKIAEGKSLAVKILRVMQDVEGVIKDSVNEFHKYKYASDAAIIQTVRVSMIKHKLIAVPNQVSCVKEGDMTTIGVCYKLIDGDSGECVESMVYGQGQDKGDKGAYKAATGAEKYFFLKTFLIPTFDDPEGNGGSGTKKQQLDQKKGKKTEPEEVETEEMTVKAAEICEAFKLCTTKAQLEETAKGYKKDTVKLTKKLQEWLRDEYRANLKNINIEALKD